MSTLLIISLAYLTIWAIAMLREHAHLLPSCKDTEGNGPLPPPLTVIVTAHDQVDLLRSNLPYILEQEYEADFEVIVVDMNSSDETQDYLESIAPRYPHLHVTRTPATARNISPTRLALTLGIRAASNDWSVLTQADCRPASPHWLTHLGRQCAQQEGTNIVLGYTRFMGERGWHGLRCRFFRTWQQMRNLRYSTRHGAYRADGCNLCYRRSFFLSHGGFAEGSNLLTGATDIMVNHHSNRQNTTVCLHPESIMEQQLPRFKRWWREERTFFMETRRHFAHGCFYKLCYLSSVVLTWLYTLATLTAIALSWLLLPQGMAIGLTVAIVLLWLTHAIYRGICFNKATKALGETSFTLSLPLLLHLIPLWDASAWLRWLFTDRRTFQKKFI